MIKKISFSSNNDAIILLKYTLIGLLIFLTPITLFLTGFSWYASLEFSIMPDANIENLPLFLKNSLIFGSVGLMSFLVYFLVFLAINFALKNIAFEWKKFILLGAILLATLVFLIFEIFSGIFIGYFYSWQMSLVLVFWPIIYILMFVLMLVDYFELHNQQKNLKINQVQVVENDDVSDLSETIS